MKLALAPGTTSQITHVFIQDSTVTTGAGKTGLAYGDITAYYVRAGGTLTAMTMETISTLGTWASSGDNYLGFKLLHDTNAPGLYELHLPTNILAAGAASVAIQLRATGAAPCCLEIQLANVPADAKAISGDSTAADNLETACDGGSYNVGGGGVVAASVTGAVGSVTGAVGSVTGAVGSVTAGVSIADDAITAATFDESTAFPLKSADTGATAVARTGADSDTLETLSDEIAAVKGDTAAILLDTGTDGVVVAAGSKTGYSLAADQSAVTIGTVNAATLANGAHGGAAATLTLKSVAVSNAEGVGVSIAGTTAGLSVTGTAGDGIAAQSSGGNGDGMSLTGNGSGEGLTAMGGATGHGFAALAGGSSGHGIVATGNGSGCGIIATAGATGNGIEANGGATSGDAIYAEAPTDGDGLHAKAGGDGHGINADGSGSGDGIAAAGGATGSGIDAYGGVTSGSGLVARSVGGNSPGMQAIGHGSAAGLQATGGATSHGIQATGGSSSGAGIYANAQANNDAGLQCVANGTGDDLAADNIGGGGDATEANQTTIIDHLTDIKGTGFVKDTHSLPQCLTATGFAEPGDEMDLVDAPNATAVTAIQSGLAVPGDEMDLIDAPNATAVTAIQSGLATPGDIPSAADIKTALEADGSKLDHLWETTEDDGGVRRFTENALEQAPAGGGGGDATEANQTTIIDHLTDIKGTGFVKDTNSLINVSGAAPVTLVTETSVEE